MKAEFALVALPISGSVARSAFAVQYITVDQARRAIFPGKSFAAAPIKLALSQRKAIEQASGVRILHDEPQVWRVSARGWFIVEEVVGKHELITYAAGINGDDSVKQIEVMDCCEICGGQSRDQKWRTQFVGKTSKSTLDLDNDIKNNSGATLSCRHITDGVKRLLAFYD